MKTRISLLGLLLFASQIILAADVHITIDDPETWSAEALRPYIGQTVIFDQPMVLSSNYNGYTISSRRLFTPTNQELPRSTAYNTIVSLNKSGAITLNGAPSVEPLHRCGEKIYNLKVTVNSTNSVTWQSGEWRGNTRADLEAGIPDLGDYRLLICTMNLEYYLVTQYDPSSTMGPDNQEEHEKQRTKVMKALSLINADAYGLVEIQQGPNALQEIANDLNAKLPGRNYGYISDGSKVNGTYTHSGYVYDRNKLRPIGAIQNIEEKVQNRKKLQCFEELETGEKFIFSVNHFKAKTRSGASGGDADKGDGQGTFNSTRQAEAQAVLSHYKKYRKDIIDSQTGKHYVEKDVLIMGDLNAYAKEDPIMIFLNNGMIDLHRAFHADSSYSYQFSGLAGYLDHAICNSTLFPQVTGAAGFHINSDENDNYTYDGRWSDNSMFRCSDHDPVLVGLKLDNTLSMNPNPALNQYDVLTGESDVITIRNAFREGQSSYYAIYDIYGRLISGAAKHPIESSQQAIEMPFTPGVYILYIYYDRQVYKHKFIVR